MEELHSKSECFDLKFLLEKDSGGILVQELQLLCDGWGEDSPLRTLCLDYFIVELQLLA